MFFGFFARANEFLEYCTERFLLPSRSAYNTTTDDDGVVLDLGCGSGRDTVYMAQHLPPGTRVIGVDNHSLALDRGARLAEQWLECGGGGGGVASDHSTTTSGAAGSLELGKKKTGRVAGRSGADGDCGKGREGPGAQRRGCEWLLADLRKQGALDGLRASVVHGHRFKCEQLLPLLRDDVSGAWTPPAPSRCFLFSFSSNQVLAEARICRARSTSTHLFGRAAFFKW